MIGIAGELLADGAIFVFSRHLQTLSEGEYATLNQEAGTARKQAAEALREQEQLKTDNLKLQKELLLQGPRANLLVGEPRRVLVDSLRPFTGRKIDVRYIGIIGQLNGVPIGSPSVAEERNGLAKSLIRILKDAGWQSPEVPLACRFNVGQGLNVYVLDNASTATREASKALVKALSEVPLAVDGPGPISMDFAKRVEAEAMQSPPFSKDTILLVVSPK